MNRRAMDLTAAYLDTIVDITADIDAELRPRRGPAPTIGTRTLIGALTYLGLAQLPLHLRLAAEELAGAHPRDLKALGITTAPTYWELIRTFHRWANHIDTQPDPAAHRRQTINRLIAASTDPTPAPYRAVDTNYFDAYCRPVKRPNPDDDTYPTAEPEPEQRRKPGPRPVPPGVAADPDAAGRILDGNGQTKRFYGYGLVAVVRAGGPGPEVCDAIDIIPANANDAPIGAELLIDYGLGTNGFERALADRGYSQQTAFLDALRAAGIPITYDLKTTERGRTGTYLGADIIDGGLYNPSMPKRLHKPDRPVLHSNSERYRQWRATQKERETWAYPSHAAPTASQVRLAPPSQRGRIRCESLPHTQAYTNLTLPTCRTPHQPGHGCLARSVTYPATASPRSWQYPFWGSREWEEIYNCRTAVERFFSHIESDAGVAWRAGRFRLRGITPVSLLLTTAVTATNLRLANSRSLSATTSQLLAA